jgi:putative permease
VKIQNLESTIKQHFNLEFEFGITNLLNQFGSNSSNWLVSRLTSLLSNIASATFMVPLFSFFILKDGQTYGKELLKLVPEKYNSSIVLTVGKAAKSLSKFIRAKALEAFLVFLLTYIGLLICGSEYAGTLALIAGITNILPYIGPVLGYIPALALLGFGWPVFFVFLLVNMIDLIIIFPVMIGKLVNLSPLSLLVAVAVGQELYGLVGMLVSVPVASSIKIIYQEIIHTLYAEK